MTKLPHGIKRTDWLVFDMDEGMLYIAPTRRAAVKRYEVDEMVVRGRYTYGPGAYEYGYGMPGDHDGGRQLFIYRADVAMQVGYAATIEAGVRNFDEDDEDGGGRKAAPRDGAPAGEVSRWATDTTAEPIELSRAQKSTLRVMAERLCGTAPRNRANVAFGFYVNSLPALERHGLIERYDDPEIVGDDMSARTARPRVRVTQAGYAHLGIKSPAEPVTVTPIDATPEQTLALLHDVAARAAELSPYVTWAKGNDDAVLWHLCGADGQPIAAGEYDDPESHRFRIGATPPVMSAAGDRGWQEPRAVCIAWLEGDDATDEMIGWTRAEYLGHGWHWVPESY